MILRRIADAVVDQNWITVVIEILIVVIGIYIGLLVTDWDDSRKALGREKVYLTELRDDITATRANIKRRLDPLADRIAAMVRVLRSLEACDDTIATRGDFDIAFTQYPNTIGFGVVDVTYQEMLASGAFAALQDNALKRRVADAYAQINVISWYGDQVRRSLTLVDETIWDYVQFSTTDAGKVILSEYDFEAICQQRRFVNAVVEMVDMQKDYEGKITPLTRTLISVEDELLQAVSP